MARPIRICIPETPLHVVQRGNNRQACFHHRNDYIRYLGYLDKASRRYDVRVHAYALMTNHVHLLITPGTEDGASRMMQSLGSSYVRAFNRIYDRSGTLWEGRFRSFPVAEERYLFACYRYIEMNPVLAGIVASPDDYPWSSFRANAMESPNAILQPRREWTSLGKSRKERCAAYRHFFDTVLDTEVIAEIRASLMTGSELGSEQCSDPKLD